MMRRWEKNKKDDATFLRGTVLFEALEWMRVHPDLLSSAECVFIEECYRHQLQEQERLQAIYEKLKQSEDMEKYQDNFLLNMSHELRTPLTTISGFAELLSEYSDNMSIDQSRECLLQVREGCNDLSIILTSVFDASSLKEKIVNTNIIMEPLSVYSVIEEISKYFANFLKKGKYEILIDMVALH